MNGSYPTLLAYAAPLTVIWGWYLARARSRERRSIAVRDQSSAVGLAEPSSLHPVIDTTRCIGCGSCVKACPEQPEHHVLGLIHNKAHLISPSDCIGHGACRAACPVDAITLVFGSAQRGVDIPLLSPSFETSVAGHLHRRRAGWHGPDSQRADTGSPGCGRHTQARGLTARPPRPGHRRRRPGRLRGLTHGDIARHEICRRSSRSHSAAAVFQYPRAKMVMTSPVTLPLVGKVRFGQTSKEALLEFWRGVEARTGLPIRYGERVDSIAGDGEAASWCAPRKANTARQACCSRSGGAARHASSACPARSYRRSSIDWSIRSSTPARTSSSSAAATARSKRLRASPRKAAGRSRCPIAATRSRAPSRGTASAVAAAERSGRLQVLLESEVRRIEPGSVVVACEGREIELRQRCSDRQRGRHPAGRVPPQRRHRGRDEVWHRVVRSPRLRGSPRRSDRAS